MQMWARDMNRHFTKEDVYEANKHMKKCLPPLVIREMQIKTTLRYHLTPVRMAITKKYGDNRCWSRCGEIGTLLHCGWQCKLVKPLCGNSSRTQKQKYHSTQKSHYWVYTERIINCSVIKTHAQVCSLCTVYNTKGLEPTQMPINDRLDKENVAHIHHGMLHSHKKRCVCVLCRDMDKSGEHSQQTRHKKRK